MIELKIIPLASWAIDSEVQKMLLKKISRQNIFR